MSKEPCLTIYGLMTGDRIERELDRMRYLSRLKAERDEATRKYFEEHGPEYFRKEGVEEGILMGRVQAFQKLLGLPVQTTTDLEQLSEEELSALGDQLEQQLLQARRSTP